MRHQTQINWRACLVTLSIPVLVVGYGVHTCSGWWDGITREHDDRERAAAEKSRREQEEATAKQVRDEATRVAQEKGWEDGRRATFRAMTPAGRLAAAASACPPKGGVCDAKGLESLAAVAAESPPGGEQSAILNSISKAREARVATEREQKRADHAAARMVKCCDGTIGGCLCSAPSKRGYCSHHGGICGCEE